MDDLREILYGETDNEAVRGLIDRMLLLPSWVREGHAWFVFEAREQERLTATYLDAIAADQALDGNDWRAIHAATWSGARSGKEGWLADVMDRLMPSPQPVQPIEVKAVRDIVPGAPDFAGAGLVKRLYDLRHPEDTTDLTSREQFRAVEGFVKTLFNDSDASIDFPGSLSTLHVVIDGRELPLQNLGTGVAEVIMIAVAATVNRETVLCIEEPEIHLHPLLQRHLVRYLIENTTNQYLITTHSAHLLDSAAGAIHRTELASGWTSVRSVLDARSQFDLCSALGYHASDLLQSNALIWVEGPSDRIYINHWIKGRAPHLREGEHYSIMFYGGRLLSHLAATDEEVDGFVALAPINQNIAIVMDSDRASKDGRPNATKQRVAKAVRKEKGLVWVTKGREIEHYVKSSVLSEEISSLFPGASLPKTIGPYTRLFRPGSPRIDKVKLARSIAERAPDYDRLDLGKQIKALVRFIERSNPPIVRAPDGDE